MVEENETAIEPIPNWLEKELFIKFLQEDFKEFKSIKEFQVEPTAGKGENYTTLLLRVKIILELKDGSQTNTSYMVKVLPTALSIRDMVSDWKVFVKENNTYANYVPEFEQMYREANKNITFGPKYYKLEKEVDEPVVVLEDLGRKGFRNASRQNGFDLLHTKAALEKLAQFHAASAVRYETKGPFPNIYDRNLCSKADQFKDFRDTQTESLIRALPLYEASHLSNILKSYGSIASDMFQSYAPKFDNEFRVLNHGDAWCNNFMFQYDKSGNLSETYFVDLQMSRYSSPAQDLLYMILSSVNIDIKLTKFDYFIQYYHDKLIENLKLLKYPKSLPTLKSLHVDIFKHSDWIFPIISVLLPICLTDSNDNANMDTMMNQKADGDQFRNTLFENSRIIKHLRLILPWAHSRGAFELS